MHATIISLSLLFLHHHHLFVECTVKKFVTSNRCFLQLSDLKLTLMISLTFELPSDGGDNEGKRRERG